MCISTLSLSTAKWFKLLHWKQLMRFIYASVDLQLLGFDESFYTELFIASFAFVQLAVEMISVYLVWNGRRIWKVLWCSVCFVLFFKFGLVYQPCVSASVRFSKLLIYFWKYNGKRNVCSQVRNMRTHLVPTPVWIFLLTLEWIKHFHGLRQLLLIVWVPVNSYKQSIIWHLACL